MANFRITDTTLSRLANGVRRILGSSGNLSMNTILETVEKSSVVDTANDTVTADKMLQETTAHDSSGNLINGSLTVNQYRTGTSEPDNSLGDNGDWYLVTEE